MIKCFIAPGMKRVLQIVRDCEQTTVSSTWAVQEVSAIFFIAAIPRVGLEENWRNVTLCQPGVELL